MSLFDKYEYDVHPAVAKAAGESLPSRRYICKVCGTKGKRNNSRESRLMDQVCPSCIRNLGDLDRLINWESECKARRPA